MYTSHKKNLNIAQQLYDITQAKHQLTIKQTHYERLKRITKDAKELQEIEQQLHQIRMDFLKYSTTMF